MFGGGKGRRLEDTLQRNRYSRRGVGRQAQKKNAVGNISRVVQSSMCLWSNAGSGKYQSNLQHSSVHINHPCALRNQAVLGMPECAHPISWCRGPLTFPKWMSSPTVRRHGGWTPRRRGKGTPIHLDGALDGLHRFAVVRHRGTPGKRMGRGWRSGEGRWMRVGTKSASPYHTRCRTSTHVCTSPTTTPGSIRRGRGGGSEMCTKNGPTRFSQWSILVLPTMVTLV